MEAAPLTKIATVESKQVIIDKAKNRIQIKRQEIEKLSNNDNNNTDTNAELARSNTDLFIAEAKQLLLTVTNKYDKNNIRHNYELS